MNKEMSMKQNPAERGGQSCIKASDEKGPVAFVLLEMSTQLAERSTALVEKTIEKLYCVMRVEPGDPRTDKRSELVSSWPPYFRDMAAALLEIEASLEELEGALKRLEF